MRLRQLHLLAFGPFTDRVLDFGRGERQLFIVHGPNEAGKSSALRALSDLRFGIPAQSPDKFIHDYADMRIGGVFADGQGREASVMRRKKLRGSLSLHDFQGSETQVGPVVPPELEALLTGGLTRKDYLAMFSLDHQGLRDGGRALSAGEGEVGAALFEASAGVRSVPALMAKLDEQARQHYAPRAQKPSINQALAAFSEQQDTYKKAVAKPAVWVDLQRQCEASRAELERLQQALAEARVRGALLAELRVVGPLMDKLQAARRAAEALSAVPLLAPTATTERVSAETSRAQAKAQLQTLGEEIRSAQDAIANLPSDPRVLELAPAISRLAAAAEGIDAAEQEARLLAQQLNAERAEWEQFAARMDVTPHAEELVSLVPSATEQVWIEDVLKRLGDALMRWSGHAEQRPAEAGLQTAVQGDTPPPQGARLALEAARSEVVRHDVSLSEQVRLPAELLAAQREADAALLAVGLGAERLHIISLLLDADIDAAVQLQQTTQQALQDKRQRIADIEAALELETKQLEALLAQGEVPTADDVAEARRLRDARWLRLKIGYLAAQPPDAALAAAFEVELRDADRLSDALGRDAERAEAQQSQRRVLARLTGDADTLRADVAKALAGAEARALEWRERLQAAGLPDIAPAALRQWQQRFLQAQQAAATVLRLRDEQQRAGELDRQLRVDLRDALAACGVERPSDTVNLRHLTALADARVQQLDHLARQQLADASASKAREEQRAQWAEREQTLRATVSALAEELVPVLDRLLLPTLATPADAVAARSDPFSSLNVALDTVRARLEEFDTLSTLHVALLASQQKLQRLAATLQGHRAQAEAVAAHLGLEATGPLRLVIDPLAERLAVAQRIDKERQLLTRQMANSEAEQLQQQEALRRHEAVLQRLSEAAGVASSDQLIDAEEQSASRREAQREWRDKEALLAQASARSEDELAVLLREQDALGSNEEEAVRQSLSTLEEQLRQARTVDEQARQALQAVDSGNAAAAAREAMEQSAASVRQHMGPWVRSRLAHALLAEATRRFRERAQGPMFKAASAYFSQMTLGEFTGLVSDDTQEQPTLLALRRDGRKLQVTELSEGTRDQLYLALRLAALELQRARGADLPVLLDDVLMTSDDRRAAAMVQALLAFSAGSQVIVFTHHAHLVDVARQAVGTDALGVLHLPSSAGG